MTARVQAQKHSGTLDSSQGERSFRASVPQALHLHLTLAHTWQASSRRMHSLDFSRRLEPGDPPSALQRESSSRQWKMSLAPKEWPIRVTGRSPWPPASSRTARRCPAF